MKMMIFLLSIGWVIFVYYPTYLIYLLCCGDNVGINSLVLLIAVNFYEYLVGFSFKVDCIKYIYFMNATSGD
jgi:hypothetical protein